MSFCTVYAKFEGFVKLSLSDVCIRDEKELMFYPFSDLPVK